MKRILVLEPKSKLSALKLRETIDILYSRGRANSDTYTRHVINSIRCNDDFNQAKRLQSHMDLHFNQPNSTFLHNRLLQFYTKSGQLSHARNLFDKMPKRDIFTYNAMLSAYSKLGSVDDLQGFFNEMPLHDSVSFNTVISGLASNGCSMEALGFFVRMGKEGFVVSEYTIVSALNACSRSFDLIRGKQIHARIVVCDFGGNSFVSNALIDMYAKCREINHARWLFNLMRNKNLVSWNLMVSGYMKNGQPELCVDLFKEMQMSGLQPDQVTVSNVLGSFFKIGHVDEACKAFNEIKEKDKICWTTMISNFVRNGYEENALSLFNDMLFENVRPDSFTISTIVSSCAKLASLNHGQVIHGKSIHMGVDFDLLVSTALIDMYSKCGETKDSWLIFYTMPTKNVVSWNAMILGYAQNGKDLEALALYEEMLKKNLEPDDITFVGILSACMHAGLTEKGEEYFQSINKLHQMTPNLDHYACMINLLGRSGYIEKAFDLIKKMSHQPNSLIWSTLLSVCKLYGDIKHGETAAKQLIELDPLNAEPYITLSNMYASCKRWKDVANMRSLMKNKDVKKFAAYSWIEIDGVVYKFLSEDRTHKDSDIIYLELNKLIKKIIELGFIPNQNLVLHDVGEREKFESICYHSEKLALAFGLIKKPNLIKPIRIMKNIRVCVDCHMFMKFASRVIGRSIILRDSKRFHHFIGGDCSCKDLW